MSLENKELEKKTPSERVQRIVDILLNDFPEGVTLSNVSEIIVHAMQVVGELPNTDGYEKKQLVIDTINAFVDTHDAGTYDDQIDGIVKFMMPKLIDQLIAVEDKKLRFNKKGMFAFFCMPGRCCNRDGNCCKGRCNPQ